MYSRVLLTLFALFILAGPAIGQTSPEPIGSGFPVTVTMGSDDDDRPAIATTLKIVLLLTLLSVLPALLLTLTSFTRIVIVLSFLRNALNTQSLPPNQILIGFSLFLTLVVMQPILDSIYSEAISPYLSEEIELTEAIDTSAHHLRGFLIKHTREDDLALFLQITKSPRPEGPDDVPFQILVASFVISELKTAFQIGFILFLPFLVIDMVISSILLSMGMFMLPPMIISTPFKILLFILVDGWNLVIGSLMGGLLSA